MLKLSKIKVTKSETKYTFVSKNTHIRKYIYNVTSRKETFTTPIYYMSLLPSSGKTHWSINTMLKNHKEKKLITFYCSPTVKLLQQTYFDLVAKGVPETAINFIASDVSKTNALITGTTNVLPECINAYNAAEPGDIFLITHKLFSMLSLPRGSKKLSTQVLFDEAAEFSIKKFSVDLKVKQETFISKHAYALIDIDESVVLPENVNKDKPFRINKNELKQFMRIECSTYAVDRYKKKANDNKNRDFIEIIQAMADPRFSVFASVVEKKDMNFYYYVSPESMFAEFHSVYLLSAFFDFSDLYFIMYKYYTLTDVSSYVTENKNVTKNRMVSVIDRYKKLTLLPITDEPSMLSKLSLQKKYILNSKYPDVVSNILHKYFPDYLKEANYDFYKDNKKEKTSLSHNFLSQVNEHAQEPMLTAKSQVVNTCIAQLRLSLHKNGLSPLNYAILESPIRNYLLESFIKLKEKGVKKTLVVLNTFTEKLVKEYVKILSKKYKIKYEFISPKSHGLNFYQDFDAMIFLSAMNPPNDLKGFLKEFLPEYQTNFHWVASNACQAVGRTALRNVKSTKPIYMIVYSNMVAKVIQQALNSYVGFDIAIEEADKINNYLEFTGTDLVYNKPRKVGAPNKKGLSFKDYREKDKKLNDYYKELNRIYKRKQSGAASDKDLEKAKAKSFARLAYLIRKDGNISYAMQEKNLQLVNQYHPKEYEKFKAWKTHP